MPWNDETFARLTTAAPEPLTSSFAVSHSFLLNVLDREEGGVAATTRLLLDNHEPRAARRDALVERAVQVLASLLRAEVVEPDDGSTRDDWLPALEVPAADAVAPPPADDAAADPEGAEPARGVGGDVGADGDGSGADPRDAPSAGLGSLGMLLAEAGITSTSTEDKADTSESGDAPAPAEPDHEPGPLERFLRVQDDPYPEGPFQVALDLHQQISPFNQPLSAFALAALELLDPAAPGYALDIITVIESTLDDPRPVLMAQRFEAGGEAAVGAMKADGMDYEDRMEALDDVSWPRPLAEELEGALRVYRQTHPWVDPRGLSPKSVVREMYERAMTFGEYTAHHKLARAEGVVLRYLTDAYRALRSTVPTSARTEELDDLVEWLGEVVRHTDSSLLDEWESLANPTDLPTSEVRPSSEGRALSANPRALRVMVRQNMFRRIELVSLRRWSALAALDGGLTAEEWEDAASAYLAEYGDLGTGPEARGPALFRVTEEDGLWVVEQILDDPDGDHDWRITAELDLAATDEAGEVVLVVTGFGPATAWPLSASTCATRPPPRRTRCRTSARPWTR